MNERTNELTVGWMDGRTDGLINSNFSSLFQFDRDRGPAWKYAKVDVASSLNIAIYLFLFIHSFTVVIPYPLAFTAHAKNQAVQVSWCDQDSKSRGETKNVDRRSQQNSCCWKWVNCLVWSFLKALSTTSTGSLRSFLWRWHILEMSLQKLDWRCTYWLWTSKAYSGLSLCFLTYFSSISWDFISEF